MAGVDKRPSNPLITLGVVSSGRGVGEGGIGGIEGIEGELTCDTAKREVIS